MANLRGAISYQLAASLFALSLLHGGFPDGPGALPAHNMAIVHFAITLGSFCPAIAATVNGKEPLSLGLDTSSPYSIISESEVLKLGLGAATAPSPRNSHVPIENGSDNKARVVYVPTVQIGDVRIFNMVFGIVEDDTFSAAYGRSCDAVIGTTFLNDHALMVDYPRHEITVWSSGGLTNAELTSAGFTAVTRAPLSFLKTLGLYTVRVSSVEGGFDDLTPSTRDTTSRLSFAAKDRFKLAYVARRGDAISTVEVPGTSEKLGEMSIGRQHLKDILLWVPDKAEPECRAVIGSDLLSCGKILFDAPAKSVYISLYKPTASAAKVASSLRKFGTLRSVGSDSYGNQLFSVVVNGRPLKNIEFDSGRYMSNLKASAATRIGLKQRGSSGDPDNTNLAEVNLQIGTGWMDTLPLGIIDDRQFEQAFDRDVNGFIGEDLMDRSATLFDFTGRRVTIATPGDLTSADIKRLGMADAAVLTMRRTNNQIIGDHRGLIAYAVHGLVNGIDQEFLLATGANHTSIPLHLVRRLKLRPLSNVEGEADVGPISAKATRVSKVSLGSINIYHLKVAYFDPPRLDFPSAIIGLDIFAKCMVLIDVPGRKVYIKLARAASSNSTSSRVQVRRRQRTNARDIP